DDPDDAQLLLELLTLHHDKLRAWVPDDELTRTLVLLVQYRRQLIDERTSLTNRLTSLLKLYYPQALRWAGGLATQQAGEFLRHWPTLADIQRAPATTLRKFYLAHGCRKAELIEQRLQEIKLAQPLTRDLAVITASVSMVQAIVNQLRALITAVAQMEKQITELFGQHPDHDLFESFPGAGPVLAPRLLTAMGADRQRFSVAREVQQFSGIAPVTERSGQSCWVHWRRACPKFVRQRFHEYAARSIRWSPWAKAFYEQQRQKGNVSAIQIGGCGSRIWPSFANLFQQVSWASQRTREWRARLDRQMIAGMKISPLFQSCVEQRVWNVPRSPRQRHRINLRPQQSMRQDDRGR